MNRQEAIEFLMDHYENPRNSGPLDHAHVSLTGGNPGCADLITMHARFNEDGKLEAVNWEGEGCTISSAAASYVTEITRATCATLALGTLKKGVHEYSMRKRARDTHYHTDSKD